ncbi:MAG: Ribosomal large subunit pseudouridine synthase D [Opitutia bacterium UBA7350]|nr:MAG: Ribosomal large subunit pseudouridine synthase D [Opitutae bacterium UBA7350]
MGNRKVQMSDSQITDTDAPLIDPDALLGWILQEDEDLLVVNKPGWLVCHPSKNGPWSSLVGAVREYLQLDKLHLVARLDRETSGLVIFARRRAVARQYQMAIQDRRVLKSYYAILEGELKEKVIVDKAIGRRKSGGPVYIKNEVRLHGGGQDALTEFEPVACGGGYTLTRVKPHTGRKHQIRVHAEYIGHRVIGDKLYGPDEHLYLEFIEHGFTEQLANALPLARQALHCYEYIFQFPEGEQRYIAPLTQDLQDFVRDRMHLSLNLC